MSVLSRWYEVLPEAVLGAGLVVFLIDETDAATSAFKSGRAVALMAAAAIGWLIARLVLARVVPRPVLRAVVLVPAALAALAVVVLPAYNDDRVVEMFPAGVAAPIPAPVPADVEVEAPEPADPVRVGTASFMGIDHRAVGTVNLYRHADGRHVVGLEDFDIQPGPDYDVYVVPGSGRTDMAAASASTTSAGTRAPSSTTSRPAPAPAWARARGPSWSGARPSGSRSPTPRRPDPGLPAGSG